MVVWGGGANGGLFQGISDSLLMLDLTVTFLNLYLNL